MGVDYGFTFYPKNDDFPGMFLQLVERISLYAKLGDVEEQGGGAGRRPALAMPSDSHFAAYAREIFQSNKGIDVEWCYKFQNTKREYDGSPEAAVISVELNGISYDYSGSRCELLGLGLGSDLWTRLPKPALPGAHRVFTDRSGRAFPSLDSSEEKYAWRLLMDVDNSTAPAEDFFLRVCALEEYSRHDSLIAHAYGHGEGFCEGFGDMLFVCHADPREFLCDLIRVVLYHRFSATLWVIEEDGLEKLLEKLVACFGNENVPDRLAQPEGMYEHRGYRQFIERMQPSVLRRIADISDETVAGWLIDFAAANDSFFMYQDAGNGLALLCIDWHQPLLPVYEHLYQKLTDV